MKIKQALGNRVFIQRIERETEKTTSGIILTTKKDARYASLGTVTHVGTDVAIVKVGDLVAFQPMAGTLIDDDLFVINTVDIYCVCDEA